MSACIIQIDRITSYYFRLVLLSGKVGKEVNTFLSIKQILS